MADKSSAEAKPSKVFDVAKPGKSAPSASSKPIIVTNRPVLKDPMMLENADTSEAESTKLPLNHIKISPLSAEDKEGKDDKKDKTPDAQPDEEPKKADDEPSATDAAEPAAPAKTTLGEKNIKPLTITAPLEDEKDEKDDAKAEAKPSETADEPEAADKTAAGAAADQASPAELPATDERDTPAQTDDDDESDSPDKPGAEKKDEAAIAAEEKHAAELQALIESRKYYLPINQVEKRKNKRYAVAGTILILLLAVAWADVAADAGLITIPGVKPVTHFFSN